MLFTRFTCLVVIGLAGVLPASTVSAQEDSKKEEQKTPAVNRFALPKGATTEELGSFLKQLRTRRPRNRDEATQRVTSILETSSAILKGKPDAELEVLASDAKLSMLAVMPQVDEDFEGPTPAEFAEQLGKSQNPKLALIGKHFALDARASGLLKMKPKDLQSYLDECFDLTKEYGIDAKTFTLLNSRIGRAFEQGGRTKDAIKVYSKLAPMMASSKDERLSAYKPKLEGAVRRLQLIGNPIALTGTTHKGEKFDWSAYKGKVVLIDFWATWCGPCVRELPNMMRNYEDFHGKGFEIIGINMDSDRGRFKKFVEDREVPWVHIMGTKEKFGWDQPIAAHYGVSSIPTQMLVGRDGKVISLNLRGRALDIRLEKLLGGRPGKDAEAGDKPAKKTEDKAAKK